MGKERTGLGPNQREISLPEELESLSPICQEGVREVLARLKRMEEKKLWFKTRTPEKLELLLPQVSQISQELYAALKPFKRGMTWFAARLGTGFALSAALGAAKLHEARSEAFLLALDAASDAAGNPHDDAAWKAASDADESVCWEMVKDRPGFEKNPFLPFLSLYELGTARINFRKVDGEEKLVVDFPLQILKNGKVLACLVFGEDVDGSYDQKVFYIHKWDEDCSCLQPITPLIPLRVILAKP